MKTKLPVGLSAVIALVLVAFGLLYGTWSGYTADRAAVTELLEAANGLMDVLDYRAADGFNLCVVARRHLSADDADLAALEKAAHALRDSNELAARRTADAELSAAVNAVSSKLESTPSFQVSARDASYLTMLNADLSNLSTSAAVSTYNEAAQAFNQKLDTPLLGALAKLLGIEACLLYQ